MALKIITEAEITDKRVIARFDFNVPLKDGKITDTTRIDLALPTIEYILEQKPSKFILMSHLGRPAGKRDLKYSLEPVATYLSERIGEEIIFTEGAVDSGIKELLTIGTTKIVLLENLRFHPEETKDDEEFAFKLSEYADIYVNDAFGAAHRKHASTYGINKFFTGRTYSGILLQSEIRNLDTILNKPKKPFVAVIGGAKVADKIKTIEKLIVSVDHLIIGGAMAYPFLKAKGGKVGNSLCSDQDVELAKSILRADRSNKIMLPSDHVISSTFDGAPSDCATTAVPDNMMALDIGINTVARYSDVLKTAKTVLWNGPMGIFEDPNYAKGTSALCETIANLTDAYTLVGGGDSVAAVKESGLGDKFSHISTGGGASLEYIEKGELPGIQALKFGV